jgi:pimeloyl-ACP methyl ester carboxylesterase
MSVTRINVNEMSSPEAMNPSSSRIPRARREGFLFSGHTQKAGAKIDYTLRMPRNVESMQPVLLVPGFGGIKPVYGELRDALANSLKRPVASFRHPRAERSVIHGSLTNKIFHPAKLGGQSVVAMIDELHQHLGQNVTLAGHSMGGPNAVDGALRRPHLVEGVLMMGSGGLERGQNSLRLAGRMPGIVIEELIPGLEEMANEDALKIGAQALYHVMRNPWRTTGEAIDISNRPLMTQELRQLGEYGIRTQALQFEQDHFFPVNVAIRDASNLVDSMLVMPEANHLAPQTQPERTAEYITSLLTHSAGSIVAA